MNTFFVKETKQVLTLLYQEDLVKLLLITKLKKHYKEEINLGN